MADDRDEERDETVPDQPPAKHPTDDDDEASKKKKDEAVDHASEQSMDGSDAPSW
jgi:hypothetical protein